MQHHLKFSKYHIGIVVTYVLLTPVFIVFLRSGQHYVLGHDDRLQLASAVAVCTFFIFLGILYWKKGWPNLGLSGIFWAIVYGVIFAIPEEIIFRGIIQGLLRTHIANDLISVILSSLIFGVAHLPNGSKSLHPRGWNWRFAGLTLLAGLPLGWIFALTHSLLIPTLLHTLFVVCLQLFPSQLDATKQASH